jgi:L-fucose dehydrogenase
MNLNLQNKVIIVTGGARGIGESIVRKLADENAIPCIIDLNESLANKLYDDVIKAGKKCFVVITDLTKHDECKLAVDKILKEFSCIDGLVNNAGLNDGIGIENGSYEGFMQSLNLNVGHYYLMAHLTLNELKKSKGSIVNICSKVAETGQGGTSGYAAANGVRYQLTTQWANELAAYDIRVNAIVVAECFTPQYEWWINQQSNPKEELEKINAKIPLEKRMTKPEEIADTTLFLLSAASALINGQFFYVDGGYVHLDRKI